MRKALQCFLSHMMSGYEGKKVGSRLDRKRTMEQHFLLGEEEAEWQLCLLFFFTGV